MRNKIKHFKTAPQRDLAHTSQLGQRPKGERPLSLPIWWTFQPCLWIPFCLWRLKTGHRFELIPEGKVLQAETSGTSLSLQEFSRRGSRERETDRRGRQSLPPPLASPPPPPPPPGFAARRLLLDELGQAGCRRHPPGGTAAGPWLEVGRAAGISVRLLGAIGVRGLVHGQQPAAPEAPSESARSKSAASRLTPDWTGPPATQQQQLEQAAASATGARWLARPSGRRLR